jgi:hypothetical protein
MIVAEPGIQPSVHQIGSTSTVGIASLLSGSTGIPQTLRTFFARRHQLTVCFIAASPSNATQSPRISTPGKPT